MFKSMTISFLLFVSSVCHAGVVFPVNQYDVKGEVTDQDLSSIYSLEQQGDDDNWDSYLEFYPSRKQYKGIFVFDSPVNDPAGITHIDLLANYRGAESEFQKWTLKLRDFKARKWIFLANNNGASSWQWYQMTALINDDPQRFVNAQNKMKLMYVSNNSFDASQLDFVSLNIAADEATVVDDNNLDTGEENNVDKPVVAEDVTWWQPEIGLKWQVQYVGNQNDLAFDVLNVDLFDMPTTDIALLKAQGKHIVCYFSAGSTENWRPDFNQFLSVVVGNDYENWEGEAWLDIRRQDILLPIMQARIELAAEKGCDAVDPDNTNGYANKTGFNMSYADQISYNKALAELAHNAGLAIGLKNDVEQINDLVADFDFAVNESCFEYDECHLMNGFVDQNKPVVAIDYNAVGDGFCAEANRLNFDGIKKNWDLDAWVSACR